MASQVKTEFIAEGVDLYVRSYDLAAKAADNFATKTNNSFANLKTPSFAIDLRNDFAKLNKQTESLQSNFQSLASKRLDAGQVGSFSKEIVRASERSRQLTSDIHSIYKELSNPNRQTSIGFLTSELKAAEREADSLNRKLTTVRQNTGRNSVAPGSNINPAASSTLGGLGSYIVPAAIAATAIGFGKEALSAAREADAGQRILRASAKETGISFEKLTDSAAKFGAQTLQSNRDAQGSFASIVTFANAAGRSDKLDEFRTKFADLAAAKGIDPSNLGVIAKQLNALTDEATDKLLNANPSAFYDKFAKSINKTANSLSDADKRAAIFDEVIKRGAIFSGEAEKRVDASASALDRLSVKFENIKESAGAAVLPLVSFVEFASKVAVANPSLYKSGDERAAGRANAEILSKQTIDTTVSTLRSQDDKIREAIANPLKNSINSELAKINLADNFLSPQKRQEAINKAAETGQAIADALKGRLQNVLSGKDTPIGLLQLGQKQFYANQGDFDNDTRRKLAEGFETAILDKQRVAFEQRKQFAEKAAAVEKERIADLKRANDLTKEIGKNANSLISDLSLQANKDNPFVSLFSEADTSARKLRETTKGLSNDLIADFSKINDRTNSLKLFSARLDNDFNVSDLRNKAADLRKFGRDPLKPEEQRLDIRDPSKFFSDYIDFYTKKLEAEFTKRGGGATKFYRTADGGFSQVNEQPFTQHNRLANGGFSQSDARNSLLNVYDKLGSGGTFQRTRSFADLTDKEKFDFANKDNIGFQNRFSASLDLAQNRRALNPEQQADIDRKIVSLANGVDLSKLTDSQRDRVATAAEAEANRREQSESKAQTERTNQTALQTRIAAGIDKLNLVAEKEGFNAVQVLIKDETEAGIEVKRRAKTASAKDTSDYYKDGGTTYLNGYQKQF